MRFAIFPLHLSNVLCVPRKSDAKSYIVLHLSRTFILANLKIWYFKMQPLDFLTSLMNMSLILRLPRKKHLSRSFPPVPRLPSILEMPQKPERLRTPDKVQNPLHLPGKTTSERPKALRTRRIFTLLTSICTARTFSTLHLNFPTSKSGPRPSVFNTFDFEMCFAPQQGALFRHVNFRKWTEPGVLCTF